MLSEGNCYATPAPHTALDTRHAAPFSGFSPPFTAQLFLCTISINLGLIGDGVLDRICCMWAKPMYELLFDSVHEICNILIANKFLL